MITKDWVQPGDGEHQLFTASSNLTDGAGNSLVVAYPLQRPDGEWSLLVVNRDQSNPHSIRVHFDVGGAQRFFAGPVRMVTFGSEQYVWHSNGPSSNADPDGPPAASSVEGGAGAVYTLPKASITVLRGKVNGPNEQ
jgi:hypothetical protein